MWRVRRHFGFCRQLPKHPLHQWISEKVVVNCETCLIQNNLTSTKGGCINGQITSKATKSVGLFCRMVCFLTTGYLFTFFSVSLISLNSVKVTFWGPDQSSRLLQIRLVLSCFRFTSGGTFKRSPHKKMQWFCPRASCSFLSRTPQQARAAYLNQCCHHRGHPRHHSCRPLDSSVREFWCGCPSCCLPTHTHLKSKAYHI